MKDWTIDVGRYRDGQRMILPVPGWKGAHALAGGSTHAGKTSALRVVAGRIALEYGELVAFVVIDPHSVGFMDFEDRCSLIAYGWGNAYKALPLLLDEMRRRMEIMFEHRIREWTPEVADLIGPYLVVVIDELVAITGLPKPAKGDSPQREVVRLAQELRKAGGGLLLGCNSPKATHIGAAILENCPIRMCFRAQTAEQTEAILESRRWPAHDTEHPEGIGVDEPGGCFVNDSYRVRRGRTLGLTDQAMARIVEKTRYDTPDLGFPERVLLPFDERRK